ncbi:mitochondrial ribosomal small subunit component [Rhizophlyctis rosea]|nr:mitochondrial ribosomal small subunit component [Rhizophlyctis rosea]
MAGWELRLRRGLITSPPTPQHHNTNPTTHFHTPHHSLTTRPTPLKKSMVGRAVWKGPFFVPFPNVPAGQIINTYARACTILPSFIGRKFGVHNGKEFIPVTITEEMVGRRLGEFSFTKKKMTFKKKDDKKK